MPLRQRVLIGVNTVYYGRAVGRIRQLFGCLNPEIKRLWAERDVPKVHAKINALLYAKVFGCTPIAGGTSVHQCKHGRRCALGAPGRNETP